MFISENVSIENVNKSEALSKLFIFFGKYKDRLVLRSRIARLRIQYLEYVTTVKNFIRAGRTGNWHLHLVSTSQMLNLFTATGHVNYAKSTRMCMQMMLELPVKYPDLYEKFSTEGYHTVTRSDRFWGGLWTSLMIEQCMMRSIKSRGGLTRGSGMTDTVRLTWIHSLVDTKTSLQRCYNVAVQRRSDVVI